ncbi:MAG: hypothetical protein IT422_00430 [Pirellulaceae bacterium]|nr:hypothetical protein [Pirellulaceae bacterium]
MRPLKPYRWLSVLTLTIALQTSTASAQSNDTLSFSGVFHMDQLSGVVGADLAEVFARNNDHSWSLTLSGVTCSNDDAYDYEQDIEYFITRVHAASFDLEFFGPDADVLNAVISEQLTGSSLGGDVFLELRNIYSYAGFYPGGATWDFGLLPLDESTGVSFFAGAWSNYLTGVWFPTEDRVFSYGYPLLEPQMITSQRTSIQDSRPGNSGALRSIGDDLEISTNGSPVLPPTLNIDDASALEGNRGTTYLNMPVTLSRISIDVVTVHYQTVSGSAQAKSDYASASGTLTFQPGQTTRTIPIAIKGDRKREPNESFNVLLSNPTCATIEDAVARVTILNDD